MFQLQSLYKTYCRIWKGDHELCPSGWPRRLKCRLCLLGYWDHGFEYRSRHGCLSLCFCVALYCVGRGLCGELITRAILPYVLIRLRDVRCESVKDLTRTVEPLMMMIMNCKQTVLMEAILMYLEVNFGHLPGLDEVNHKQQCQDNLELCRE
jgi:hypothetical protein